MATVRVVSLQRTQLVLTRLKELLQCEITKHDRLLMTSTKLQSEQFADYEVVIPSCDFNVWLGAEITQYSLENAPFEWHEITKPQQLRKSPKILNLRNSKWSYPKQWNYPIYSCEITKRQQFEVWIYKSRQIRRVSVEHPHTFDLEPNRRTRAPMRAINQRSLRPVKCFFDNNFNFAGVAANRNLKHNYRCEFKGGTSQRRKALGAFQRPKPVTLSIKAIMRGAFPSFWDLKKWCALETERTTHWTIVRRNCSLRHARLVPAPPRNVLFLWYGHEMCRSHDDSGCLTEQALFPTPPVLPPDFVLSEFSLALLGLTSFADFGSNLAVAFCISAGVSTLLVRCCFEWSMAAARRSWTHSRNILLHPRIDHCRKFSVVRLFSLVTSVALNKASPSSHLNCAQISLLVLKRSDFRCPRSDVKKKRVISTSASITSRCSIENSRIQSTSLQLLLPSFLLILSLLLLLLFLLWVVIRMATNPTTEVWTAELTNFNVHVVFLRPSTMFARYNPKESTNSHRQSFLSLFLLPLMTFLESHSKTIHTIPRISQSALDLDLGNALRTQSLRSQWGGTPTTCRFQDQLAGIKRTNDENSNVILTKLSTYSSQLRREKSYFILLWNEMTFWHCNEWKSHRDKWQTFWHCNAAMNRTNKIDQQRYRRDELIEIRQ